MVMSNGLFQSLENFETATRVEDALSSFDKKRFESVSAVVFFGIVELSGTVATYYDRAVAMQIARDVPGVTTVVESIQIRPNSQLSKPHMRWRPRPVPFYLNLSEDRVSRHSGMSND